MDPFVFSTDGSVFILTPKLSERIFTGESSLWYNERGMTATYIKSDRATPRVCRQGASNSEGYLGLWYNQDRKYKKSAIGG